MCLLKSSEKVPSSFSPQSNSLLPSSINLFLLCKYAGTFWHYYSCSYMVTRIRELIRVKNSSAKEKVIYNPAEFPSPVLGVAVVPWGGCSTGPTESGSGEWRGRSWHCCWAASVVSTLLPQQKGAPGERASGKLVTKARMWDDVQPVWAGKASLGGVPGVFTTPCSLELGSCGSDGDCVSSAMVWRWPRHIDKNVSCAVSAPFLPLQIVKHKLTYTALHFWVPLNTYRQSLDLQDLEEKNF